MRNFLNELKRRNVLRVAAAYLAITWIVIQVLETVFPIFDLSETYIRWVIIALGIFLVPVLTLAWVFEWSAKGITSQEAVDRDVSAPSRDTRRFDRAVILLLSLAVFYFAVDKFLLPRIGLDAGGPPVVAVLPFGDVTADRDAVFLGDGLADDLLNLLSRNPALQVAARRSSFRFRDSQTPLAEIARQLSVSHILDGSVRSIGDRVRISVQLVSARDGYNVWSDVFDRSLDDIVAVKNTILTEVEAALGVAGARLADHREAPDPQAYVLVLRANYRTDDGTVEGKRQAVELYREALRLDPDYTTAWINLAVTYINQAVDGHIPFEEGYLKAREAVLEAIRIDPESAAGYKTLSFINRYFEGDMRAAVANMQLALAGDPTSFAVLEDSGTLLLNIGQLDEAVRVQEYIVSRSPVDVIAAWNLALRYRYADRLADSERVFERVRELEPEKSEINYHQGETVLLLGRYDEALALFEAEEDEAYRLKGRALACYALGRRQQADAALANLVERFGDQWPSEVAHVYAYRGELDEAFAWLDREYDKYGPGGWGEWQLQRLYDNLRGDPRWEAFLQRTGTSAEELSRLTLELPTGIPR